MLDESRGIMRMDGPDTSARKYRSQGINILRSFTMSVYESYQVQFPQQKMTQDELLWVMETQKSINKYVANILQLSRTEIINGIQNQDFVRWQEKVIGDRMRVIPKASMQVFNLLFQKLVEAFSLHNQVLMDEWVLEDQN
ncbi:MAG TPA: hypothetical protein VJ044_09525 [Candidatus Hodarchaeales archaeon]|nr:hypothetical protein [Candidatus Hodarchaeales archaeon]